MESLAVVGVVVVLVVLIGATRLWRGRVGPSVTRRTDDRTAEERNLDWKAIGKVIGFLVGFAVIGIASRSCH